MRLTFMIILMAYFCQVSFAETNADSLLWELKNSHENINKVEVLEKLAWKYHRTHPNKTILYASQSLELAMELNYKIGIIRGKNILGVAYSIQGDLPKSFQTFEESIALAEASNNQLHICRTYNNLGRNYMKIGNFEKAVNFYQQSAECSEQFDLKQQMSDNLLNMASAMQEQGLPETALKYANEALDIAIEIKDETLFNDAHQLLGTLYIEKNELEKALSHLEKALSQAESLNDKVSISSISNQLGIIFSKKKQPQNALNSHRKAYKSASQINYQEQMISALIHLAELYLKNKDFKKSIEKSREGIHLAEQFGALRKVTKLYDLLAKGYAAQQDFPQAYIYHTKLKILSDSLINIEKNQKLNELKIQFQLENKEAENQLLKAQQAKDKLTIQKANIASTAIILALLTVCVIAFYLFKGFRYKQRQSRKLKKEVLNRTHELEKMNNSLTKSNKEMERFNHIASHDLKEPLRNIISFTKLLELRLKKEEDQVAQEYLSFVITNAKQMNTLIEDVLEFSKFADKKIEFEQADLSKIFQQVLTTLQPTLEEKTAHILCDDLPCIISNSTQLYIMMKNIIENGIIYNNHPTPIIKISYQRKNFHHHISITDNGIGIDPIYHRQIFDMFKRLQNRKESAGSGLGLSISQKIANRLGGEILIQSAPNQGSTFTIMLPVDTTEATQTITPKNQPTFKVLS